MAAGLRQRLLQGELLAGTILSIGAPEVAELLAGLGFDWLFVDAEHGALDPRDVQTAIRAANATPCLVRIPALDDVAIKKALDSGAAGIIVPQINSADEAARAVWSARFPPAGGRGLGVARANRYGAEVRESLERANDEVVVVVQAETAKAVAAIDEIVRVPGVDAVLIGPYDLSTSLSHPGELDHPVVTGAIDRIAGACHAAGLRVGIFGMTAEAVRPYVARGFTLVVAGVDIVLLRRAAIDLLQRLRP